MTGGNFVREVKGKQLLALKRCAWRTHQSHVNFVHATSFVMPFYIFLEHLAHQQGPAKIESNRAAGRLFSRSLRTCAHAWPTFVGQEGL